VIKGILAAFCTSFITIWLLGWSRALSNEGAFGGREVLAFALVCALSALAYWVFARKSGRQRWAVVSGLVASCLLVPAIVYLGPLLFCMTFMPNTPCV